MNKQKIAQHLLIVIFTLISSFSYSQDFEGWIAYKIEPTNPNPEWFPDSSWQNTIKEFYGEGGFFVKKYFYKNGKYFSEIETVKEKGFEAYDNEDKKIYSWLLNSDSAVSIDSRKNLDELVEIIESQELDTILKIPCKSIIVKSKLGQIIIWYNNKYFKMDGTSYKGHKYGHWGEILNKIGCLPIKIEQQGFRGSFIQTAIDFREEHLKEEQFLIPKFTNVWVNPVN